MPHRKHAPDLKEVEECLLELVISIRKTKSGHYRIDKIDKPRVDAAIHVAQRILASRNSGNVAT